MIKTRYEWVDILKFLGIFAIYLGHYGTTAQGFYLFVFGYHVPLFFFIAGFFAKYKSDESLWSFIKKKFKSIMIPYFIFAFVYLIIMLVTKNFQYTDILTRIKEILFGVRNTKAVANLWFLPCLFSILVIHKTISIFFKNKKYLYLMFAVFTVIIAYYLFPLLKISVPSVFFNIDSAIYYYIYFFLGMISLPIINNFNVTKIKLTKKILFLIISIFSIVFTVLFYQFGYKEICYIVNPHNSKIVAILLEHLKTLILIYFNVLVSFGLFHVFKTNFLNKYNVLPKIGQSTLYLCGIEFTWKMIIWKIFLVLGVTFNLNSIHTLLLYNFIIILLATYVIVPIIKKIFVLMKLQK